MKRKEKRDFAYYFIRLTALEDEMERKRAEGLDTSIRLPLYFERILKNYWITKMTAKERKVIKKLREDLQEKFG